MISTGEFGKLSISTTLSRAEASCLRDVIPNQVLAPKTETKTRLKTKIDEKDLTTEVTVLYI
jgi:hypothetical protein